MSSPTTELSAIECAGSVLRIAAVSRDDQVRLQLARAFDAAPAGWDVTLHDSPPHDADVLVAGPDTKVGGAIRFDPADPQGLITAIEESSARQATGPMVVVGASGGCGATTVAVHLAAVGKACLIDASGGDIRRRLDMPGAKSWAPALAGEAVELSALPVAPGFRVLLAPDDGERDLTRVLDLAGTAFPIVILETGRAGLDRIAAPRIGVLVATPTRPSCERAAEIVAAYTETRWAIVTNRVGSGSSLTKRRLEAIVGRKLAVELPCSPALRDAEDSGRLVTSPLSVWLWQVKRLWRALRTA